MNRPLLVRPKAERDVAEARDWYEKEQEGLGDQFLTAVQQGYLRIQQNPELHAFEYRDIRRIMTDRFPYNIFYRVKSDEIEVIAVMHGHRHPRTWRSRL
jgi:plasmid stabilization system protein ParE